MKTYFNNQEIEELADGIIRQYLGPQYRNYSFVDIENFITKGLKLPVVYHNFAEIDTDKIGFISDGMTPLTISIRGKIDHRFFPKGTIVIEKYLLNKEETGRRRFTLAHEAAHYIMDCTIPAAAFHREYDRDKSYSQKELQALLNFQESRVDRLGAALLMPFFIVQNAMEQVIGKHTIPIYGENIFRFEDKLRIQKLAQHMGVSYTALMIRLKELGLLERKTLSEFLTAQIGIGSEAIIE